MLVGGVLEATSHEVAVELRLVNGTYWPETHRYRWELPKVRHETRVRIGGKASTLSRLFLTEGVHLRLGQPAL